MSLIDFLKKPKKEPEKKEIKKTAEKKKIKEKKIEKPIVRKPRTKGLNLAWRILKEPHISEKATDLNKENKYVFDVFPRSNKKEIKEAVEAVYNVNVIRVNIIRVPQKPKRRGRIEGFKKGYKKAIVQIKKDQKIELLPR